MSNSSRKYIDPLTNFGFQRIFGTEANKGLLIDFLNQLLPEAHQLAEIEFAEPVRLGPVKRKIRRDEEIHLYCKSASGERIFVEVKNAWLKYFRERSLFFTTFPLEDQEKYGDWETELEAVYLIRILDFEFKEEEEPKYLHEIQWMDQDGQVFDKKLKYIFLELPKFEKQLEDLENRLEKWLYVFRNLSELDEVPASFQDEVFARLFESTARSGLKLEEEYAYEDSLIRFWELKNMGEYAFHDGLEKGKKMG